MSEAAIHAEGLGKRYRVGERERYLALRDVLTRAFSAPFRGRRQRSGNDYLWALRDVSFDIRQGEVVGLIGRNGAGKSTLLKILSRITRPTAGYAEIRGSVGSLLEVGTGFHPELTGRENIYLSGAVLGMKRAEIGRKFDEIVVFAEVERFLDTPLKHYSSGMQMRLAFAVAAHLEPEILLVDEVLAVGDIAFQKKCLGKMKEVSSTGRTIVFISHQMNQIRRLCTRANWLDAGEIRKCGPVAQVVSAYELALVSGDMRDAPSRCFLRWEIAGSENVLHDGMGETTLCLDIYLREAVLRGHLGVNIFSDAEILVGGWGFDEINIPEGYQTLRVTFPFLPLKSGIYSIGCSLFNRGNNLNAGELVESWQAAQPLLVDAAPRSHSQDRWSGLLNIPGELSVSPASANSSGAGTRGEPDYQSEGPKT